MKMYERLSLFFLDHGIIPLQVQEGYLAAFNQDRSAQAVQIMAEQAEFISLGDTFSAEIHSR